MTFLLSGYLKLKIGKIPKFGVGIENREFLIKFFITDTLHTNDAHASIDLMYILSACSVVSIPVLTIKSPVHPLSFAFALRSFDTYYSQLKVVTVYGIQYGIFVPLGFPSGNWLLQKCFCF